MLSSPARMRQNLIDLRTSTPAVGVIINYLFPSDQNPSKASTHPLGSVGLQACSCGSAPEVNPVKLCLLFASITERIGEEDDGTILGKWRHLWTLVSCSTVAYATERMEGAQYLKSPEDVLTARKCLKVINHTDYMYVHSYDSLRFKPVTHV